MSFEDFRQHLEGSGRSPLTVQGYLRDLDDLARWYRATSGQELRPQALSPLDVREYRQHLLAVRQLAPATVNRRLAAIRAYCHFCRTKGAMALDPTEGLSGAVEQEHAPRWLSRQEVARLLRSLEMAINGARTEAWRRQGIRDRAIVYLLLYAGLRVGELCALELADLELGERAGQVLVRWGKGGKRRTVPLNGAARRALREWLKVRPQGPRWLFLGKGGKELTPSGVQRRLGELGRQAGVELTPHALRHTCAKRLVDAGVSLEKVAAILGHESLDTTKVYLTPSLADLQEAVDRVG
ncbi:MAG: tyrosine-type recombinase/integrase [Anaerolineae bacterium]